MKIEYRLEIFSQLRTQYLIGCDDDVGQNQADYFPTSLSLYPYIIILKPYHFLMFGH